MAKDPAFLFFPGDWLGGTLHFTRHQKGAYMDLLMAQFSAGHMELEEIRTVLGDLDFSTLWEQKLKKKFVIDSDGKFFNQKLEDEINKRRKYTDSRKGNLKKEKISNPHMDPHMGAHMENGNGIINRSYTGERGTGERGSQPPGVPIIQQMMDEWMKAQPSYPKDPEADHRELFTIGAFIAGQLKKQWIPDPDNLKVNKLLVDTWAKMAVWIAQDDFYKTISLGMLSKTKNLQSIWQKLTAKKAAAAPIVHISKKPIKPLPRDQVQYACVDCATHGMEEDQQLAMMARAKLNAHGIGHCGLCGHEKEITHIRHFNYLQNLQSAAQ